MHCDGNILIVIILCNCSLQFLNQPAHQNLQVYLSFLKTGLKIMVEHTVVSLNVGRFYQFESRDPHKTNLRVLHLLHSLQGIPPTKPAGNIHTTKRSLRKPHKPSEVDYRSLTYLGNTLSSEDLLSRGKSPYKPRDL